MVTEASLKRAALKAERLREALAARDDLIRQAITEGWTHQRIAEATGLTRARVGQIALRSR